MDQESGPVTGTDIYAFTEEGTRPEQALRALSETLDVSCRRMEWPVCAQRGSCTGGTLPACRPCTFGDQASSSEGPPV
jgi:hypothetical protein